MEDAIRKAFASVPPSELPKPREALASAILQREQVMSTFLGRGLAVPHARLAGLDKPVLLLVRSEDGVLVAGRSERAHLLFIVLTSTASPRDQARLLARMGGLLDSELVERQLPEGRSVEEVLEAIRSGELSVLGMSRVDGREGSCLVYSYKRIWRRPRPFPSTASSGRSPTPRGCAS